MNTQFTVNRKTPAYWRVTFHNPPINLLDPDTIYELLTLMDRFETDPELKVVVFDSADPDYFIAHYDMARAGEAQKTPSASDLPAWFDFTTRLAKSSVVSIAEIRGRARGIGSEFALACDMRFASREKAVFGQPEVAVGVVPGGGGNEMLARLAGRARALEIVLGADDYDAGTAERYGWINRALPDAELTGFVDNLAHRIASFDSRTLSEAKRLLNRAGLPDAPELIESRTAFLSLAVTESTRETLTKAIAQGLGRAGGFELDLGARLGRLERSG
ncbi:Enoyl-CoA hydratase/carnithine racemase [Paenibacillus sp. UNC496MF]|uniref:enoyl-CoA hydratase/isomerase family protein n=1 Tax=Paenibacillus sp. UNC496MF TaxID=1502753 RepID=UPI0008E15240|nr:enoyl-CoA hydratase/isomerase family protein [Paenibacillus sp. UNC496MF]SFJ47948.1 Enoyl-CoA hydratase/carnithine racemase [Paenibacillus sp. UNC496MF]